MSEHNPVMQVRGGGDRFLIGSSTPPLKKTRKEYFREWYAKNREYKIKKTREHQIKTNYASEKTEQARAMRYIKRETRRLYPLAGKDCQYCSNKATEHHHTTNPITKHDFDYVCHGCHVWLERQKVQNE